MKEMNLTASSRLLNNSKKTLTMMKVALIMVILTLVALNIYNHSYNTRIIGIRYLYSLNYSFYCDKVTEQEDNNKGVPTKTVAQNSEDSIWGRLLWNHTVKDYISSSPALGDIDDDGKLEVVVGSDDHNLYALNGEDGTLLWTYSTNHWVLSSPALGDIDDDGKLEVVVGGQDSNIYALNGEDGTLLWNYTTGDHIHSSPAIGDVDGDGKLEIVIGSADGNVYVLNGEDGTIQWKYNTNHPVYSSPALGDIDNDGKLEILVGGWHNFYALNGEDGTPLWVLKQYCDYRMQPVLGDIDNNNKLEAIIENAGGNFYVLNGEDGTIVWKTTHVNPPALGDVDSDGKLEIIAMRDEMGRNDSLYVFNGEDGTILWNYTEKYFYSSLSSPALGDLNGDGKLEIIVGATFTLYIFSGESGAILWQYKTEGHITSPALGDIDNDGKIEIVVGSGNNIYAFDFPSAGKHVYWQGLSGTSAFTRTKNQYDIDPDYDCLATEYEKIIGTDPYNNDSDGDNIRDSVELYIYHTDPTNSDTDGDGFRDDIELKLGTDPTNAKSSPWRYYILPSVATVLTVIVAVLMVFSYRRLMHHLRIKRLIKVTGAPSYAEAIKVKEGKFNDYEEYKLAQKLMAPNKEALELTVTLDAPDYPTAQKVQETGFKDYQSYRLALQQGYKNFEDWSAASNRLRQLVDFILQHRPSRLSIDALMSLLHFDDFEHFCCFLSSLPSDLVVIDGDYVLFPFVSSDDETFQSALKRLMSSFPLSKPSND